MKKTLEEIKNEIHILATEYYNLAYLNKKTSDYIPVSGKSVGVEELHAMIEASLDMWLTTGRFNKEFEKNFAEKFGVKYALSTNSGSSANLLALSALTSPKLGDRQVKRGDEVITVAAGFPTTVNPIIQNGLVPVFVDLELYSYNINIDYIEEAITSRTKVIFLAHTLGNMYDIDAIMSLAKKYNLWVIEDSCDALGARWKGRYAGTIGHIGTFSFYPAHHITMGEGGAIVTNDTKLYRIIMSYRDWGRDCWCQPGRDNTCKKRFTFQLGNLPIGYDHKYIYSHIGYNLKITDWQAAIGVEQLKKLDIFLEQRRKNAGILLKELSDLKKWLILPEHNKHCNPSWFGFLISVRPEAPFTKQEIVEYLEDYGVGTRQLFAGNILRQPMITNNNIDFRIGSGPIINSNNLDQQQYSLLPNTDFIMEHTFWIGTAQNINEEDELKSSNIIHRFISIKDK